MATNWEDIEGKPFDKVGKSLAVNTGKELIWDSDYVIDGDGIVIDNQPDGKIKVTNTYLYEWLPSQTWTGSLSRVLPKAPIFYSLSICHTPFSLLTGMFSFVKIDGFLHLLLNDTLRGLYDFSVCYGLNSLSKPFLSRCTFRTVFEEGNFMTDTGRPNIACADIEDNYLWLSFCHTGYTPEDGSTAFSIKGLMSNLQCTATGTMVDFISVEESRIKPFDRAGSEKINIDYTTPDYSNDTF